MSKSEILAALEELRRSISASIDQLTVELHRPSSSVPLHTSPSPSMSPLPPDLSFHSQPTLPPPPPRSERPPPSIFQPPLPQVPPQSIPPQPTVAASPESRPLPAAPFSDLQKSGSFEMVTETAPPEALPLPATPTSPLRLQTAPSAADDPLAANYGEIPLVDDNPHAVGKKMQFVVVRRSGLTVQRVLTVAPNLVSPQMVKFATTLSRESIVDVMANFTSFPVEFLSAGQRVWLCGEPPPFEGIRFYPFTDPAYFSAVRFGISTIPFLPFTFNTRCDVEVRSCSLELGLWVSHGYLSEALSFATSDASRASLISLFTMIVILLLESMLGEIVLAKIWFGILMSVIRISMLECSGSPPNIGDLFNFLNTIFFGIHTLRTEPFSKSTGKENLALLGYEVVVVAVLSTVWCLVLVSVELVLLGFF